MNVKRVVRFAPPGWGENLRPQAVRVLMEAKRSSTNLTDVHLHLSKRGLFIELEATDAIRLEQGRQELQRRLDDAWHDAA